MSEGNREDGGGIPRSVWFKEYGYRIGERASGGIGPEAGQRINVPYWKRATHFFKLLFNTNR